MNLLSFHNRFNEEVVTDKGVSERNGYVAAMTDILQYIRQQTNNGNPENRMIDSVKILECIIDTNDILAKHLRDYQMRLLSKVDMGGPLVNTFLSEQKDESDDLKHVNI